jgi:hypothetical protein
MMNDATTSRWNVGGGGGRGMKQQQLINLLVVVSLFGMLAVLCQHAFFVLDLGVVGVADSVRAATIPTIPNTDRRRTIESTTTIPLLFPIPNQNNPLVVPDAEKSTTFFDHEKKSLSTRLDNIPTSLTTPVAAAASMPSPSSVYYTCTLHNHSHRHPPTRIQLPMMKSHFIIAGAQKSGTSALYYFLRQHPHLQASKGLETHFFDWYYPSTVQKLQWMADRNLTTESEFQCAIKQAYWEMLGVGISSNSSGSASTTTTNNEKETATSTSHRDWNSIITFEKTPSYFFLDRIPELISSTFAAPPFQLPKIIIILRNPIDRAFSHWKMGAAQKGGGKGKKLLVSFEDLVVKEIRSMRALGLTHAPPFVWPPLSQQTTTITTTTSNNTDTSPTTTDSFLLEKSFSFQNLPNLSKTESDAAHWKHYRKMFSQNYLQRSMYSTQLERWIQYFPLVQHTQQNKSLLRVIQFERFLSHPHEVFQDLLTFVGASSPTTTPFVPPQGGFQVDFDPNGRPLSLSHTKKKNSTTHMTIRLPPEEGYSISNETRHYLSLFFKPYNSRLADLLGEDWRDVWM